MEEGSQCDLITKISWSNTSQNDPVLNPTFSLNTPINAHVMSDSQIMLNIDATKKLEDISNVSIMADAVFSFVNEKRLVILRYGSNLLKSSMNILSNHNSIQYYHSNISDNNILI